MDKYHYDVGDRGDNIIPMYIYKYLMKVEGKMQSAI